MSEYRVLETKTNFDGVLFDEVKIIEVETNELGEITSWFDTSETFLIARNTQELRTNFEEIQHAFRKPVLRLENNILVEI